MCKRERVTIVFPLTCKQRSKETFWPTSCEEFQFCPLCTGEKEHCTGSINFLTTAVDGSTAQWNILKNEAKSQEMQVLFAKYAMSVFQAKSATVRFLNFL